MILFTHNGLWSCCYIFIFVCVTFLKRFFLIICLHINFTSVQMFHKYNQCVSNTLSADKYTQAWFVKYAEITINLWSAEFVYLPLASNFYAVVINLV